MWGKIQPQVLNYPVFFCAGIGPLQLGVVLVLYVADFKTTITVQRLASFHEMVKHKGSKCLLI